MVMLPGYAGGICSLRDWNIGETVLCSWAVGVCGGERGKREER
jgi:hypothetical protein